MKIKLPALVLLLMGNGFLHAQMQQFNPERQDDLRFRENKGQWYNKLLYLSDIPNGKVFLEKNAFFFTIYSTEDLKRVQHPSRVEHAIIHGHSFREEFVGANESPQIQGLNPYLDYENYFLGNDPAKWASGVRIFRKIKYTNLYNGVDLVVTAGSGLQMKYDFVVAAGGNASVVKIKYTGPDRMRLKDGRLEIKTSVGTLSEDPPVAYQIINGEKTLVPCNFSLHGSELGFEFPQGYDPQYALIVDPNIVFSTYTGAIADNWGYTSTYDAQGNMFLAGLVNAGPNPNTGGTSPYYTTPGAFQSVWGGGNNATGIEWACDMGVSKFSADGSNLLYRTFIGGSDNETPNSLVADGQDNLIIYGVTYSTNFPTTSGAYSRTLHGDCDIAVVKLNAGGTALLGSTLIGGNSSDGINYDPAETTAGNLKKNYGDQNRGEVNIDNAGNIYVASCTMSSDFPVTPGAAQSTFGGRQDGCVFKMKGDCSQLIWSTYLGGSFDDACYSLDLGQSGSIYVAGGTMSSNFPTTNGAWHSTYQGGVYDGFVTRINATGTQFLSSTYAGTTGNDQVYFVKLDGDSNVYFTGQTTGAFPVQGAAYSNPNSGQFIVKMKPTLDSVFFSTVFGNGSNKPNISPTAFLVDTCQNIYVAGWGTNNSIFTSFSPIFVNDMHNMPVTSDAFQNFTDGTDFYFIVLSKNAQSLLYGSYFGGNGYEDHVDGGTSRFDKRGVMYEAICAGCGSNSITPTTAGAWSQTNDSWNCNELGLKIAFNLSSTQVHVNAYPRATGCVPLTVQFQSTTSNVSVLTWYFGDGGSSSLANPTHTFTDTGTYRVMLVGYNPNACNGHDTAYIDVWVRNDSLTADFLPNTIVNCDSNRVTLVSHNFNTTSYRWNFGDGFTSALDSVSHQYQAAGNYQVTLIVSDTSKCNLLDTFSTVVVIPPTLHASVSTSSQRGCVPLTVNFSTPFYSAATYNWQFGDGTAATGASVSHTYTTQDTFTVRVTMIDSASCNIFDTAYATIITIDSFADAAFHFHRTFFGCDSVQVTAWTTYQGATSQLWDFGDGTQTANVDSVTHMYTTAGTFTLTHYLTDT
ncbi:MAG TPA: PKD domain-containing protein, partial [Chitinophagales bacterium]|nr:PKD domain-containing protein [Chitinophagales bacterium]